MRQEGIGREHVVIEPIAGGEPQDGVEILLELVPRIRPRQRADPRIVIDELPRGRFLRLAQAAVELSTLEMFSEISLPVPSQQMMMFRMALPRTTSASIADFGEFG